MKNKQLAIIRARYNRFIRLYVLSFFVAKGIGFRFDQVHSGEQTSYVRERNKYVIYVCQRTRRVCNRFPDFRNFIFPRQRSNCSIRSISRLVKILTIDQLEIVYSLEIT